MKLVAISVALALRAYEASAQVPGSCQNGVIAIALVGLGPGAGSYPNHTLCKGASQ